MKKFSSAIMGTTAIITLIASIVFEAIGVFVGGALVKSSFSTNINAAYPIIIIIQLLCAVSFVVAVLIAQKKAAGQNLSDIPDNPSKTYIIASVIFIVCSIVLALVTITVDRDFILMNNLNPMEIASIYQMKDITLTNQQLLAKVTMNIASATRNATIAAKVVQAVVVFGAIPLFSKKHQELF